MIELGNLDLDLHLEHIEMDAFELERAQLSHLSQSQGDSSDEQDIALSADEYDFNDEF